MAHNRTRFVEKHIADALSFSPLVGILGQRQVGKTTLVEQIVGAHYLSFDDELVRTSADKTPMEFVSQFKQLQALDECQKIPAIFPALKLMVQRNKKPGQFLMAGSVRFTSRKAIQESLTGRIYTIEVLPLSLTEMHKQHIADFTKWPKMSLQALQKLVDARLKWSTLSTMEAYLKHGGLPGICFLRKETHRNAKFNSQIQTLLQRDLRLVFETSVPYENLLSLLRFLAKTQGAKFVLKDASRFSGISTITVKKILFAFESLFLIRRFRGNADIVSDVFYFEDQGLASFLSQETTTAKEQLFSYSQLFSMAHYNYMNEFELSYFETKGGASVPLVFHGKIGVYGFLLNLNEALSQSTIKSAKALLERYPNAHIFILSSGKDVRQVFPQVLKIPLLAAV